MLVCNAELYCKWSVLKAINDFGETGKTLNVLNVHIFLELRQECKFQVNLKGASI